MSTHYGPGGAVYGWQSWPDQHTGLLVGLTVILVLIGLCSWAAWKAKKELDEEASYKEEARRRHAAKMRAATELEAARRFREGK